MSQNQNQDRRQSIEPLLPAPATESNNDYDLPVRLSAPLANMGLSYSTAKYIAPLSFLYVVSLHQPVSMSMLSTFEHRHRVPFPVISVPSTDLQGRLRSSELWNDEFAKYERPPRQVPRLFLSSTLRHPRFLWPSTDHPATLAPRALEK